MKHLLYFLTGLVAVAATFSLGAVLVWGIVLAMEFLQHIHYLEIAIIVGYLVVVLGFICVTAYQVGRSIHEHVRGRR